MRVHFIMSRGSRESGAVAVVVALLVVVLVGMAAIAVDFGNAFAVKRKLSVAADAAALAAATDIAPIVIKDVTGCANGKLVPGTAQTAAETAARDTATRVNGTNDRSGASTVTAVVVSCTSADVRVQVDNRQVVPTFLGGIFGVSNTTPTRSATARVFAPSAPTGVRPIAACVQDVEDRYQPGVKYEPFLVFMDKVGVGFTGECDKDAGGQWDIVDFTDQGYFGTFTDPSCPPSGNNAQCQAAWMLNGFSGPVYFKNPRAYTTDPSTRTDAADPGLSGNSGIASGNAFIDSLKQLPGRVIQVPVVDWLSSEKVGSTSVGPRFGLTGVITVKVCASQYGSTGSYTTDPAPTAGDCAGNATPVGSSYTNEAGWWDGTTDTAQKRYGLWVQPIEWVISSPVGGPRDDCAPWDSDCTFGTLGLQLYL